MSAPVRLACISVQGRLGEPVSFEERPTGTFEDEHGVFYKGTVRQGRRWVECSVSQSRLGVPQASIVGNVLEGNVWCLEGDREEASALLRECARAALQAHIDGLQASLDSIPAPQAAPAP